MSLNEYPNDAERTDLSKAHASLRDHGLPPGPQGYDVGTIAAWVYANGWMYSIDRLGASYRAEIRPGANNGPRTFHVVEMGWTPDAAMAFALTKALPHMAPVAPSSTS